MTSSFKNAKNQKTAAKHPTGDPKRSKRRKEYNRKIKASVRHNKKSPNDETAKRLDSEYKKAKKDLKSAIEERKNQMWRELYKTLEDVWGKAYQIAFKN